MIRLNTVILTKVKVQSMNVVNLPDRASNKMRVCAIRLGAGYVCDNIHN